MLVRELSGRRFGRLLVLGEVGRTAQGKKRWRCRCDCGNEAVTTTGDLTSGGTQSCGCLQRDRTSKANRTHGASSDLLYSSWRAMMRRCYREGSSRFEHYGGRGITVCAEWHHYERFAADMGPRPYGKSLDRVDVNGNYEPGNCRWATPKEQANNRRNNVHRCRIVGEVTDLAARGLPVAAVSE